MTWRRGRTFWAWVRLNGGRRERRSLGTRDRAVAREVEHMLDVLHGRRDWQLLEAAVFGPSSVGELFDYWRRDALAELQARIEDVDLAQYVERWTQWARQHASAETVTKYVQQLRTLVPDGSSLPRSTFTRRGVAEALAAVPWSGSTKRRYLAAWSSFAEYLVDIEVLDANPVRSIRAPRNNPPRELWLPLADVLRLVDAQPEPFRALAALREGAGVEISAALNVRRGDVDLAAGTVFVRGSKTPARTRLVMVDRWAIERLGDYVRRSPSTPAALLFEGVTKWRALKVQRAALAAIELDQRYTLHDARHSYAVRHMKAGQDPHLIARNLGHRDAVMVLRVYGKYRPTAEDLARARLRAAE